MSGTVKILVGTMTGTAELCADEMADILCEKGADTDILLMDDLTPEDLTPGSLYIICTSTYGQGDIPDNAKAFYEALQDAKPDLSALRYGVFALGDRTYMQTFCLGGQKFGKLFESLGARHLGARHEHDASSGDLPEDQAADWAENWYEQALKTA